MPRFDGTDPLGWIFKITQFFDFQSTPDEDRITMASFYMDGPALSWYQWMYRNGFITSWNGLLQALETRFAGCVVSLWYWYVLSWVLVVAISLTIS